MAEFKPIFLTTLKKEGGFQKFDNDSANYVNKVLIGTNRGISAIAYYEYYKKIPTEQDLKSLTEAQAEQIFKKNYWNKINGDKIKNQSVAQLMFQYIIGSGASQLSDLKDIANMVLGKKLIASIDKTFTDSEIDIINSLNQKVYWEALKSWRHAFFISLTTKQPKKKEFLKGWQNRLNSYTFIDNNPSTTNNTGTPVTFFFNDSLDSVNYSKP